MTIYLAIAAFTMLWIFTMRRNVLENGEWQRLVPVEKHSWTILCAIFITGLMFPVYWGGRVVKLFTGSGDASK